MLFLTQLFAGTGSNRHHSARSICTAAGFTSSAALPQPLATEVATHLPHRDTAVWGVRHQDHAVDRDLRVPDERAQRLGMEIEQSVNVDPGHAGRVLAAADCYPSGVIEVYRTWA
jgi:hypothetical protein